MSHPPLIVGVRNTGNHALRDCLGLNAFWHPDNVALAAQLKRHRHIIVPLREPMRVAISWFRRPKWPHPVKLEERFNMLAKIIDSVDSVHYVCMDKVGLREKQLDDIRVAFGIQPGELAPPPNNTPKLSLDQYRRLERYVADIHNHNFIARFYDHP